MQRINIVGSAGAGKSTLGQALAAHLCCPLIELDALYWRLGWQSAPLDEFCEQVTAALDGPAWVVCGNYSSVRDIIWKQADTVLWLDYPLSLCFYRLCRRTWQRIISQEELWGGNRESWRKQFLSRDSLLLYTLRTHRRRQRDLEIDLADPEYAHLAAVRLRRPREAVAWLERVNAANERGE